MKLTINDSIFQRIPNYEAYLVYAGGIRNDVEIPRITQLLENAIAGRRIDFRESQVSDIRSVQAYRQAFGSDHASQLERLLSMICEGDEIPSQSPAVDTANAVTLSNLIAVDVLDVSNLIDDQLEIGPDSDRRDLVPGDASRDLLFCIDALDGTNHKDARKAATELRFLAREVLGAETALGKVSRDYPAIVLGEEVAK